MSVRWLHSVQAACIFGLALVRHSLIAASARVCSGRKRSRYCARNAVSKVPMTEARRIICHAPQGPLHPAAIQGGRGGTRRAVHPAVPVRKWASATVTMSGRRWPFGGLIRPGATQGLRRTCA